MTTAEKTLKVAKTKPYDHASYKWRRGFLGFLIKAIGASMLAKIDKIEGLENVPKEGPAILMINHLSIIDPILILPYIERQVVPMAKIEAYSYPVVGLFPRIYGVIPVRREEVDRKAIQLSLDVLKAGEIILVAPEGTRSPALIEGKIGIAYLSVRSEAPIVPVAVTGSQGFPALRGTKRWREPGVHYIFGKPFRFCHQHKRPNHEQFRKMTDEAMYLLAGMLPEEQRGVYRDLSQATSDTIEFLEP